jgi:hypothetical protein
MSFGRRSSDYRHAYCYDNGKIVSVTGCDSKMYIDSQGFMDFMNV